MEYKYMKIALEEAKKSLLFGDVPVGAVIVKNGKIIAKSHNKREKNKIATYHAEILVIEKACKKLKTWRLDDCILYVTLEPCLMCYGAIIQSRIPKVVYATSSDKYGFSQKINNDMIKNIKIIDLEKMYGNESKKMLREFFEDKRNKF
ncbi:MAG: nucleoside deaminase [Mollicutes bacterium]|nr:nucleoside deaminase [Mollicutes bacterium]